MLKKTNKLTKDQLAIVGLCIVVVALLVFCMNAFKSDASPSVETTVALQQTPSATVTTTVPVTEEITTSAPVQVTEAASTTAPVAVDETEEILKVVYDSINKLKSSESSYTGHKVQNINMSLVDSSVPAVNNIINGVLKAFIKEEILDYDFTNGVSPDPESDGTVTANGTFPPGDLPFSLTREGVASAKKTADGANTIYTVVIVAETSTLENPRPPHHNSGADTLDLSTVEIPIITLTRVDFEYPGAEISVTLDADGNIIGYHEHLEIKGTGEGYGLGITGYGTIEGYIDEKWDINFK